MFSALLIQELVYDIRNKHTQVVELKGFVFMYSHLCLIILLLFIGAGVWLGRTI